MRGHIILNRRNKEGAIYVPEVALQFKACTGGRRGWMDVYPTHGMYYNLRQPSSKPVLVVEWLEKNFDFVKEIDVPLLVVRFAIEEEEKKRQQIESIEQLFMDTIKNRTSVQAAGMKETTLPAVRRLKEIMDTTLAGEIPVAKKYAIALQIQRWIHDAGGLC